MDKNSHVEAVCLLSKLNETHQHIEVTVDMDEMDVTAAESKATYDEIREWVQENYGFHVTNLNIAQVKRKHGFDSSGRNRLKEAGAGTSPGMYRLLLCYILIIYDYAQMNQKYRYPVITAVKV